MPLDPSVVMGASAGSDGLASQGTRDRGDAAPKTRPEADNPRAEEPVAPVPAVQPARDSRRVHVAEATEPSSHDDDSDYQQETSES